MYLVGKIVVGGAEFSLCLALPNKASLMLLLWLLIKTSITRSTWVSNNGPGLEEGSSSLLVRLKLSMIKL